MKCLKLGSVLLCAPRCCQKLGYHSCPNDHALVYQYCTKFWKKIHNTGTNLYTSIVHNTSIPVLWSPSTGTIAFNFRIIDGHIEFPYYRLFFDKSNKRSTKFETAVTWSKGARNIRFVNIITYIIEESKLLVQYWYTILEQICIN
jgi:hypothetical protein